jgi:hypothetical protein
VIDQYAMKIVKAVNCHNLYVRTFKRSNKNFNTCVLSHNETAMDGLISTKFSMHPIV